MPEELQQAAQLYLIVMIISTGKDSQRTNAEHGD